MNEDPEGEQAEADEGEGPRHDPGSASDRLADALERIAFKLHDFGTWLLGFLR